MTTMFKTMTVLGALSVGGLGLGEVAWAASDDATNAQRPGIDCPGPGWGHGMMGQGRGAGFKGRRFDPDRHLSAEQIRVLTEARLIRTGDDAEFKVGEIKPSGDDSYTVQILNADGSVARSFDVAGNGMPMGRPR